MLRYFPIVSCLPFPRSVPFEVLIFLLFFFRFFFFKLFASDLSYRCVFVSFPPLLCFSLARFGAYHCLIVVMSHIMGFAASLHSSLFISPSSVCVPYTLLGSTSYYYPHHSVPYNERVLGRFNHTCPEFSIHSIHPFAPSHPFIIKSSFMITLVSF